MLDKSAEKVAADKATWFSESLARGLLVARAFDRHSPKMRCSDVAAKTGLTRAAARRYLLTLRELGYLGADGDWFYPMPRVLELGYSFISSARLEDFVEPILKRLSDETGTAAHFAVLDKNETLCLGSVFSPKMSGFFISIGARHPAYAGSMGKVLLAGLRDKELDAYLASVPRSAHTAETLIGTAALRREVLAARKTGYALNRGELNTGIVGIAVPVRGKDGSVAAVVNVNWISVHGIKQAEIKRCLGPLREAAEQIELRLSSGAVPTGWISR
ncbi:MAG: IclR family transcriptional regulator C-terminal domain-containing protein [Xanthobacteraceae bacterium]